MSDRVYLSRLLTNLRSREVRRDLSDCMAMHRTLMRAFPDGLSTDHSARAEAGVLYRVEATSDGTIALLVQSALPPEWSNLPSSWIHPSAVPQVKEITDALGRVVVGSLLRFKLVANPTRKICTKTCEDGRRNNGKRVELRGEQEWVGWLGRKAEQSGFRLRAVSATAHVPDLRTAGETKVTGQKTLPDGCVSRLTFRGVAFEGRMEVVDCGLFQASLRAGIGPGKAYGYGLLSIAPGD
jgi:CRISPR system Cascade subunit CasE